MNRADKRRELKYAARSGAAVEGNPQLAQALASARALHQRGQLQEAARLYQGILQQQPAHAEASHGLGLVAHQTGRHDLAAKLIATAVAAAPRNAVYHTNLGVVLKELGRFEEAVASYRTALRFEPRLAQTRSNLGAAQLALGQTEAAAASHRAAIAIDPSYAEAHNNLGLAQMELGRADDAATSYRQAIALNGNYANAYNNLSVALKRLDRLDEALEAARAAVELKPQHAGAHDSIGTILMEQRRFEEAADSFRRAVLIQPNGMAYRHLGMALMGMGRFADAAGTYRLALDLDADDVATHNELGHALEEMSDYAGAAASFGRSLALLPDDADVETSLGGALLMAGEMSRGGEHLRRALTLQPEHSRACQITLFMGLYDSSDDPLELAASSRRYAALISDGARVIIDHPNTADPERRLRVGLVSGDFWKHSVSRFLETVLASLDARELELFAYAASAHSDVVTERLKQSVPNWRTAVNLGDDALTAAIVADQIDILVDLSGYTSHGRLPVFARKPAPVQVSWLGYSATTGLGAIDYILADRHVIPPGEENQFAETPWRLPDSYLCFSPPRSSVQVMPLPALSRGLVSFGSFNNANKLSDRTIGCWSRVLQEVPASRLLLKAAGLDKPAGAQGLLDRFAAHGIAAHRLDLRGYAMMVADHLSSYDEVDIGLDPFPYAGTTTTAEAFWMGVPVLTLKGDRFISHVGESMLHSMGLADWIAENVDDYVAKAVRFSSDLDGLAALRQGLRQRLLASPLGDAPRFARNLETAFRGMWRIWCEKQRLLPFSIPGDSP